MTSIAERIVTPIVIVSVLGAWIAEGGAKGAKPTTLRNDMVDINFATYATFFDGLLSQDGKAQRIYKEASVFLSAVFGCHLGGQTG